MLFLPGQDSSKVDMKLKKLVLTRPALATVLTASGQSPESPTQVSHLAHQHFQGGRCFLMHSTGFLTTKMTEI